MPETDEDLADARADLCRFLAACYYEPAPEFAEERLFESMQAAAARVHPELAEHARRLGEAFAAQDLQTLLVDYTRLFLGPTQTLAQPYGSVWQNGETTLMQETTLAVVELYEQGGFEIDAAFHELPDHVAVELEFLYLLLFKRNQARRANDDGAGAALAALQQRFLVQHLGAWIGPFTRAVQASAQTSFYRELGAFTERFVRQAAEPQEPSAIRH
ncbi:MAG: molecular chaperone TorD family protein [Rubrivivax sp.]|nr:molecular chaperone TorD family protein [Rubrivivax sp.]